MRCGDRRGLAALARGELDEGQAAAARAHLDACARCAEEARWLAAERRLFARRLRIAPAPPPFAAVLAEARRGGATARSGWRARAWPLAVAAAALLGLVASRQRPRGGEAREIVAEPAMELSCFEGQPVAVEMEAFATDRAIAGVEDQYGACMLATPLSRPARGACAPPVDRAVTCDPLGPREGEAVE